LYNSTVKSLLRKYSVNPDRRKGQSFLANHAIARSIVECAELTPDDVVLEIGGGLGVLTQWIAETGCEVKVIEVDSGLVRALSDFFGERENVFVLEGDALTIDLPDANKVISNLPYNISSEVTFRLLHEMDFHVAVLMYQKEFAERLVALPGSSRYSRLTVNATYLASVETVMDVSATQFYPEPSVDSRVVKMRHRKSGPFARDYPVFQWLVRGIYPYPNKQTRKALGIWLRTLNLDKSMAELIIQRTSGLDGKERLRALTLTNVIALADAALEMIIDGLLPDPRGESREDG
jgi:16S rRNA (adenine1518-N6/adenine1519-N6)-dimethyltransferase